MWVFLTTEVCRRKLLTSRAHGCQVDIVCWRLLMMDRLMAHEDQAWDRKIMKVMIAFIAMLVLSSSIKAEALDTLAILKRNLGAAIEVISEREIRYCPDNTCEVFKMQRSQNSSYLPSFVFLHLFHRSGYIYLKRGFK